ncbi:MAG: stage II sporulation protein M [Firmicutes bacterium]|nr:stage II sporulation protein M [Bacillota bacterium]
MPFRDELKDFIYRHVKSRPGPYTIACVLFTMGVIFGAIAVRIIDSAQRYELRGYLYTFVRYFLEKPHIATIRGAREAFLSPLQKAMTMVVAGISVIGAPVIPVMLFIHGFGIGFTVGLMVDEMALKGALMACSALLPHSVLQVPAIIIIGAESLTFTWAWISVKLFKTDVSLRQAFISTILISAMMILVVAIAAAIEVYLTPVLLRSILGVLV